MVEYVPTGHDKHCDADVARSDVEYVPLGQEVQLVAPGPELYVPSGHDAHPLILVLLSVYPLIPGMNILRSYGSEDVIPSIVEYVPTGHGLHGSVRVF